jgi:hypothetical protein
VSEILPLKWQDGDFENLKMRVTRKVVNGRVSTVKTEYSEDELPLDQDFSRELLHWKAQCPPSFEGWLFPAPLTGASLLCERNPEGLPENRWPKRSLSARTEKQPVWVVPPYVSLAARRERSSDRCSAEVDAARTDRNHDGRVRGNALMESKREANSKVVRMVLRPSG